LYYYFVCLLVDALYACVFRCWFGLFHIDPNSLVCGSCCKESGMITNAIFNHLCSACYLTVCFCLNNIKLLSAETGIFIKQ
jgi:hypothetical protein